MNLWFGWEMWWEFTVKYCMSWSEILWVYHWQFCDCLRWLSWQGTFESKDSAGLWSKWSSFELLQMQVDTWRIIWRVSEILSIFIPATGWGLSKPWCLQSVNNLIYSLSRERCWPSRNWSVNLRYLPEEKPWMLLMLGGSGAGKGTFLRVTWLNFR